ncbi:hypothetical protein PR202_gb28524 [Eleusine coracana subsp. coracana]|uniref:Uncharacterized protein n=1 Tax=Eleusine coracana subsp. coracana TaxID=191504 RepID=A0AAV5FX21_ELECO|nr:hypothetical protein QOZ80_6AG0551470 [Eleusine coracana subsp. coracana]GJN39408.1 hypothetical protein PR202_gb28524 [Eleusine coracana subsp. coracana]
MEPSDLNTHLPPRKRLLAGLRTAASAFDADPPPSPPAATDLAARLREMALAANASSSSPEEMIEAARAAATAAADAAAAARAAAAEKAAVAAKARAAARAAMEFLDSFSRSGSSRNNNNGLQLKVRSRKKHVQVKLLYKPNGRVEGRGAVLDAPPNKPRRRREPDQDVARTLPRAVNTSPRISPTGPKRPRSTPRDEADASNVSSSAHAPTQVAELPNGRKSGDTTVPFFKHEVPDDGGEENSSKNATKSSDNGDAVGSLNAARKVKIKRKELLLNQNTSKETQPVVPGESKSNGNDVEKCVNPADTKAPVDGLAPLKITSVWKFKKFKTSHCSSDSKVLHNVCSSPSAAETSASVKAD